MQTVFAGEGKIGFEGETLGELVGKTKLGVGAMRDADGVSDGLGAGLALACDKVMHNPVNLVKTGSQPILPENPSSQVQYG